VSTRRLYKSSTSQEATSFLFAVTGQRPLQNLDKQYHKQQVLKDCHDEDGETCVDDEPTGSTAIQLCI
jgi:hypothetical protein